MIYFDSAATTLQKPPGVARAVAAALSTMASPGRGTYGPAARASQTLLRCREQAADLFGVGEPEGVVFTGSATHGLNIALRTLVKPGSRVLLSGYEHNAVTRPLAAIPGVDCQVVKAPIFQPESFLEDFSQKLTRNPDLVVLTHVSNVYGYRLPVEEAAKLCRERGIPLVVDASQSAGVVPIDFGDWGAAFVAMPGHKGLYGPQGTGLLLCAQPGEPILMGGTGSQSRLMEMPAFLPDRLEPGTHNVPGIAGLRVGLSYLKRRGTETLLRHEQTLCRLAAEGMEGIPGLQLFRSPKAEYQTGVLSFRLSGRDGGEAADLLASRGFALRSGLHCAPLAHRTGGTGETGTLRLSFSAFNTQEEVEAFLDAVRKL